MEKIWRTGVGRAAPAKISVVQWGEGIWLTEVGKRGEMAGRYRRERKKKNPLNKKSLAKTGKGVCWMGGILEGAVRGKGGGIRWWALVVQRRLYFLEKQFHKKRAGKKKRKYEHGRI